jgi:hypothetical protein
VLEAHRPAACALLLRVRSAASEVTLVRILRVHCSISFSLFLSNSSGDAGLFFFPSNLLLPPWRCVREGFGRGSSYLMPFASNRVPARTPSVGWARPIYCFCRSAVAWSSARSFIRSLVLCLVGSCLLVQTRVAFFGGGTRSKRASFLDRFFVNFQIFGESK